MKRHLLRSEARATNDDVHEQIVLHPEAYSDLTEIWEYIAADNLDAADRVLDEIYRAIVSLVSFPHQGHVRLDLLTLRSGCRSSIRLVSNSKVTSICPMPRTAGIVLILLITSFVTCQTVSAANRRLADEQDIREAVIRKQTEDWIKGGDKDEAQAKDADEKAIAKMLNFKIFFVSINDKDPSDDLIRQLRDIPRIIKKLSASEISKSWRMPVVDKASRQRGIIFSADKIRWLGTDSVEVEGGYHCDGLCGAGIRFRLKRENGKWLVKSSKMEWIS